MKEDKKQLDSDDNGYYEQSRIEQYTPHTRGDHGVAEDFYGDSPTIANYDVAHLSSVEKARRCDAQDAREE